MIDKRKKSAKIIFRENQKEDVRKNLSLAHYSMRLSSVFVFENCFAYIVWDHFKIRNNTSPLGLEQCYNRGMKLADVFRSENIQIDNIEPEIFEERLIFLAQEGIINYNGTSKTITLTDDKSKAPMMQMFFKMA